MIFDGTREFHPMRECIGKTIEGTGNSNCNVSLTFTDGTVLIFQQTGNDVRVSLEERRK
jgi:hypothetical protein